MPNVYLGLGSNLGDRAANLRAAIAEIAALPSTAVIRESSIYDTPPMGPQDQDAYFNMALHLQTQIEPRALLTSLQGIEANLGRAKPNDRRRWGPREIDIDILLYASDVINAPDLTVPHPGMSERWFVLKPLSDVAPEVMHPVAKKRIDALLNLLDATSAKDVSP